MKMGKRIWVVFLAVLMLLTSVPFAWATGDSDVVQDETITSFSGENSIGKMLSAELDAAKAAEEADYAITDLSMAESTATVSVKNKTACYLVVAAYDEDTARMLSSNYTMLQADAGTVSLELENLTAENMIIKAFLLDTNYKALCKNYVFQEYSKAYKDFMEQDIFDFDEDRLLNLDNAIDKNFLVLAQNVADVSQAGESNQLVDADFENNVYSFSNADTNLTKLRAGDVLYWGNDDFSQVVITSVTSVTTNADGFVTVQGEAAELEDAFEFVKIDTESKGSEFTLDESTVGEGVTPLDSGHSANPAPRKAIDVDVTKNLSKEYSIDKTFDNKDKTAKLNINGSAKFALDAEMKIYVSKKYKEVSFAVKPSIRLDFNINGEAETELQFGEFDASPVPGLFINVKPTLHFQVSGSVTTGASISMNLGFGYDSTNGVTNKSTKPEVDFDGVDTEVSIYIGIDLKPNAYFIWDNLAYVELTTECGFVATGRMAWGKQEDIIKHICKNCIDGDVKFSVKLAVDLEFFQGTKFEEVFKEDIWTKMFDVCDFYWSLTYRKFGLGECPYHLAKVDFLVLDEDTIEPISGATIKTGVTDSIAIKYNHESADIQTDADGKATYYFPVGTYTPKISATDYRAKDADEIEVVYDEDNDIYTVNDSTKQVTNETRLKVSNIIASGTCGIDARWELDKDGALTISGTGDMYNYTSTTLPWKTYNKIITSIVIENGIECIGDYDFYGLSALETLELPNSILEIGQYAFFQCINLKSCLIPKGAEFINSFAFSDCSSLETLQVSNTVKTISNNAFSNCNLLNVDLGTSVETIGNNAFYANNFTEFIFPDSVTSLGDSVLSRCPYLTYVHLGSGISTIPRYFISYSPNVKNLVIPDSVVEIPVYSFYDCSGLQALYFGKSIKKIAAAMYSRAFLNCNNLRDIYYSGSQEDWNQINITGVYRWPSDVTIHYNYPLPFSLSKAPKRAAKSVPSITKTDAVPGEEYILLAVKDSNLKTLLVPDNLLYIDQQTAESSTVTFSYVPRETSDNMSAEIYGKTMQHEHTHTDNDRNCTCDLCGQALAHVFTNYLPDGNATCNVDGTKTAICEICGKATDTIPDEGSKYIAPHHYTWIDLNDATCTANGHSKGVCSVCGAVTVGEIPESAKGHVATDWIYPEGFDCETGGDRYKECTVCHQIIMMETIEGRPHSQWIDPEVPATCTSEGLSAGIHCERCGKILLPQVVLPAGNHQADENGYATLKPATCIEDGEQTATCAICGETFTDTIPATGEHVDEDNDGYCDACEEMMVGPDHCKYCGKIHGGLFGWLVKFFHSILAIFKR